MTLSPCGGGGGGSFPACVVRCVTNNDNMGLGGASERTAHVQRHTHTDSCLHDLAKQLGSAEGRCSTPPPFPPPGLALHIPFLATYLQGNSRKHLLLEKAEEREIWVRESAVERERSRKGPHYLMKPATECYCLIYSNMHRSAKKWLLWQLRKRNIGNVKPSKR